jgi:hypothetical protein
MNLFKKFSAAIPDDSNLFMDIVTTRDIPIDQDEVLSSSFFVLVKGTKATGSTLRW